LVSTVDVNASRMVVGLKSAPIGQKRSCENARDIADFIHRPCRAANYFSNFACAWRIDRLRVAFASRRELDRAAKKAIVPRRTDDMHVEGSPKSLGRESSSLRFEANSKTKSGSDEKQ